MLKRTAPRISDNARKVRRPLPVNVLVGALPDVVASKADGRLVRSFEVKR